MDNAGEVPFHIQLNMVRGQIKDNWWLKLSLSDDLMKLLMAKYEENPERANELRDYVQAILTVALAAWTGLGPLVAGDTLLVADDLLLIRRCTFSLSSNRDEGEVILQITRYQP